MAADTAPARASADPVVEQQKSSEERWGSTADLILDELDEGRYDQNGKERSDYKPKEAKEGEPVSEFDENDEDDLDPDEGEEDDEGEDEGDPKTATKEGDAPTEIKFKTGEGDDEEEVTLSLEEVKQLHGVFKQMNGERERMFDAIEDEVKEARTELFGNIEKFHSDHKQVVTTYLTMLSELLPQKPESGQFKTYEEYNKALASYNMFVEAYNKADLLRQHSEAKVQEEQQKNRAAWIKEEREKLYRRLPAWQQDFAGMAKAAQEILVGRFGFKNEELANVVDHRFYRVFDELIRIDRASKAAREKTAETQKGKVKEKTGADTKGRRRNPPTSGQTAPSDEGRGRGRVKKAIGELKANPRSDKASQNAWMQYMEENRMFKPGGR